MTMRWSRIFVAALALQAPTTVRVDVRLVNVVATVTDGAGKHVSSLTPQDFTILEDGAPQKIAHFTQDHDVPVSVGILLDTSGSMAGKLPTATAAVERFINNVHRDDDIFLITFTRDIHLEQEFTSDRARLSRALRSLHTGGGTALYDALNAGLTKVKKGRHDKRAILVISDGFDARSRDTTLEKVLAGIRTSEVLVYGLGTAATVYADPTEHVPFTLPTPGSTARGPSAITNPQPQPAGPRRGGPPAPASGVNMSVMQQLGAASGGSAYLLSETFIKSGASEIDRILTSIADELRGQYTISYYPTAPDNGRFHNIRVTSKAGYTVRTRTGYQGR